MASDNSEQVDPTKEPPHVDVSIDPEAVPEEFLAVLRVIRPEWQEDLVDFQTSTLDVTRGLLNTMVKCSYRPDPQDAIMIRIHNKAINVFIDRSVEVLCIKHVRSKGCNAPNILATFNNGFCYEYIHGVVLTQKHLQEEPLWRLIAEELAKVNACEVYDGKTLSGAITWGDMAEKMWESYPKELKDPKKNERFQNEWLDKETLKKEVDLALDQAIQFKPRIVLSHNDTRAENIVWNEEEGVLHLVDYEAINYNYQAFEIANHFGRHTGFSPPDFSLYPDEHSQMKWLRVYLRKFYECTGKNPDDITEKDVRELYVLTNKFLLYILISAGAFGPAMENMAIIENDSIDFIDHAISSMSEYFKRKDEIMQMQMPE